MCNMKQNAANREKNYESIIFDLLFQMVNVIKLGDTESTRYEIMMEKIIQTLKSMGVYDTNKTVETLSPDDIDEICNIITTGRKS